ncbi:MAG: hypothetical protein QME44_07325 [Thermodesulfobacteriota bacterium]|nr:hypothetical protein [Thermodesulfobacteriota bacterium]
MSRLLAYLSLLVIVFLSFFASSGAEEGTRITLLLTGQTRGALEPCG